MKSYYCFVPQMGELSPESKVFKVSVGTSERDQVKLRLVQEYAKDCGLFLRIWDDVTDGYLDEMLAPTLRNCFLLGRGYKVVVLSIHRLYDAIIDGCIDSLDNDANVTRNYLLLSSKLSPRFFFRNKTHKIGENRAHLLRKNLSDGDVPRVLNALIGFVVLVLLWWLGALIEAIENTMY